MSYTRKPEEKKARAHLEAFWNRSSLGRPAMNAFTLDPSHRPKDVTPQEDRKLRDLDADYYAHTAVDNVKGGLFLTEKFPTFHINPGSGLAMLAILAGYDYEYHGNTAWIQENPGLLETEPPEWNPKSEKAQKLEDCYRKAGEALGDMGFVSSPNLLDPITVLSQMAGAENMAMGLLTQPERVDIWIEWLTEIYLYTFEHFSDIAGAYDSEVFFGPVAPGPATALQCDFSVMLSPDDFARIVMPRLSLMAERMPMTLYHLDGVEQMRFLDQLATIPQLRGIQWNPQTDYFKPSRHLNDLKAIRDKGMVLYLAVESVEEAVIVTRELGPDGLFLRFRDIFPDADEIEKTVRRLSV